MARFHGFQVGYEPRQRQKEPLLLFCGETIKIAKESLGVFICGQFRTRLVRLVESRSQEPQEIFARLVEDRPTGRVITHAINYHP